MYVSRLLTLALTLVASPAAAELYRWVDQAGVVHYTSDLTSIPEAHRPSAQLLEHPRAREPEASASPSTTGNAVPRAPGAPIMVEAYLNGVRLQLLVDTGADRTMISPAALARAGVDAQGGTPVRITGVTGVAVAPLVSVQRLDVADAQVGPLAVIAHEVPGDGVDGLLGRDVLDAFAVTLDARGNRAILAPR